jgi:DNA-directed RNA polymerase subunit K/omega
MKRIKIYEIFDAERFKEDNKYRSVVLIGRYARYLIRRSEMKKKPLEENPVIIASETFANEGIAYKEKD